MIGMDDPGTSSFVDEVLGAEASKYRTTKVFKSLDPHLDLGNLLLEDREILDSGLKNEELKQRARDNIQCLLNEIWKLPSERREEVVVVKLPKGTSRIPREKPLPKDRPVTKWKEFANLKGIQQKKKARKVWDETSQSWRPTWGYQRAKDNTKDWMIEIPDQKDPYADYFGQRQEAKKERVAKNELRRMKNLSKSAGNNPREGIGMSAQSKSPQALSRLVAQTRRSTASVGKFTDNLPKEKPPKSSGKKRKFTPNEVPGQKERTNQLEILKRLESKRPALNVEQAITDQRKAQNAEPWPKKKKTEANKRSEARNQKKHGQMRHVRKHGKTTKGKGRNNKGNK